MSRRNYAWRRRMESCWMQICVLASAERVSGICEALRRPLWYFWPLPWWPATMCGWLQRRAMSITCGHLPISVWFGFGDISPHPREKSPCLYYTLRKLSKIPSGKFDETRSRNYDSDPQMWAYHWRSSAELICIFARMLEVSPFGCGIHLFNPILSSLNLKGYRTMPWEDKATEGSIKFHLCLVQNYMSDEDSFYREIFHKCLRPKGNGPKGILWFIVLLFGS